MILGHECLKKVLEYQHINKILDIGSGQGHHSKIFRENGKEVTTINLYPPADIVGDYLNIELQKFDAIWVSHVLEHILNPHCFLQKCFMDLREDGILAITVPPLKHQVVGGHINLFNEGILLYRLILAGFDCKHARVGNYGYNLSVIVRKQRADLPKLAMDNGDIEKLKDFFPVKAYQNFDGRLGNINW